jgi:hypothetical protein
VRLNLAIDYDVTQTTAEAEEILDQIVAEEARTFIEVVRRRLEDAGVTDINMTMSETGD